MTTCPLCRADVGTPGNNHPCRYNYRTPAQIAHDSADPAFRAWLAELAREQS